MQSIYRVQFKIKNFPVCFKISSFQPASYWGPAIITIIKFATVGAVQYYVHYMYNVYNYTMTEQ